MVLSHSILYRKKMGFAVPLERWFEGVGLHSMLFDGPGDPILNSPTISSSGMIINPACAIGRLNYGRY